MSRKRRFSAEAEMEMALIHDEISGIRLRLTQMNAEREKLDNRERDLFNALHSLAKSDVARKEAQP